MVPVSVVAVEPNTVTALRTAERDGYTAVQLGAGTAREADQAARRPAHGPAAGQARARVPPRRRLRATRSARRSTSASSRPARSSTSPASPRARASPAPSSATTSSAARRRTAPTRTASRARSAPARTRARSSRARRMAGRMGNDRDHRQEADGRAHRRRAQPAAPQGPVPGARNALIMVRKAKPCPARPSVHKAGQGARHGRPARGALRGARSTTPCMHQAVTAQLAGRRTRHRTTPRRAARSAAAAPSRTARRAPAAPARARAARRTTPAAASSSARTRAATSSACPSA